MFVMAVAAVFLRGVGIAVFARSGRSFWCPNTRRMVLLVFEHQKEGPASVRTPEGRPSGVRAPEGVSLWCLGFGSTRF